MAAGDAFTWSVADVSHWVQHDLPDAVAQRPHPPIFDAADLAARFQADNVDGYSLLDLVDFIKLKDDFGITSFALRHAIMLAISQLRERSQLFASTQIQPPVQVVARDERSLHSPDRSPKSTIPEPTANNTSANDTSANSIPANRSLETFVVDASGNKRRRLNLQPASIEPSAVVGTSAVLGPSTVNLPSTLVEANALPSLQHGFLGPDLLRGDYDYGDYLMDRWGNVSGDDLLPDDDNESYTSSILAEVAEEQEELANATKPFISNEEAERIIEDVLTTMTGSFEEQQRSAVERRAWSVWMQYSGVPDLQEALLSGSRRHLQSLEDRLNVWKGGVLEEGWSSKRRLKKQCRSLEATVEDVAKERWKIDLWLRNEEPDDVADDQEDVDHDEQAMQQADSLSSTSESSVSSSATSSEPESADELRDAPLVDEGDLDAFIETDSEMVAVEDVNQNEPDVHKSPAEEIQNTTESVDELPSPSTLLRASQSARKQATPSKKIPDFITLSSAPPSPSAESMLAAPRAPSSPLLAPPSQLNPALSAAARARLQDIIENPFSASENEIKAWDFHQLRMDERRDMIIIKLVYEMAAVSRDILLDYLLRNPTSKVLNDVQNVCEAFFKANASNRLPLQDEYAGRLFLVYYHAVEDYWSLPVTRIKNDYDRVSSYDETVMWQWHAVLKTAVQRAQKQVVVIISDDDDDHEGDDSDVDEKHPVKVRKKIAANKTARKLRKQALARQEKYPLLSDRVSKLQHDGARRKVAIWAPEGSDVSQHVFLNPYLASTLQPHQIEGVRFMWRVLTTPDDEDGSGCVLAHEMGLGKTAQVISLLVTIKESLEESATKDLIPNSIRGGSYLVIAPPFLLSNWRNELVKWDPDHKLGQVSIIDATTDKESRLMILRSWHAYGGVLLIGYTMLARLVITNMQSGDETTDEVPGGGRKMTLAEQREASTILTTTPSIVVADEAHMIKNRLAKVTMAASRFNTLRRIALTGSPMSNNMDEIYALLSWVSPEYLSSREAFRSQYALPIEEGLHAESSNAQRRKSMQKLHGLSKMIAPKVHRREIDVLTGVMKPKVEFVLTIPLTEMQMVAYTKFVSHLFVQGDQRSKQGTVITQGKLFGCLAVLKLLCNHPCLLRNKLLEKPKANSKQKPAISSSPDSPASPDPELDLDALVDQSAEQHVSTLDLGDTMINDILETLPDDKRIDCSHKTRLVHGIVEGSMKVGDKVLVFSHSLPTLDYLMGTLAGAGVRFGRIDGTMASPKREAILQGMNRGQYDVLLISTRAGGLGLNIQSANRVILVDFGFSPSWEDQAIGRAYRLGQKKPVYVYKIVIGGTFEHKMYEQALFKKSMTSRVIDKKNPERNNRQPKDWLFQPRPVKQEDVFEEAGKDPQVLEMLLLDDTYLNAVRSLKTMATLQKPANDEPLNEQEQREAEEELKRSRRAPGPQSSFQ